MSEPIDDSLSIEYQQVKSGSWAVVNPKGRGMTSELAMVLHALGPYENTRKVPYLVRAGMLAPFHPVPSIFE